MMFNVGDWICLEMVIYCEVFYYLLFIIEGLFVCECLLVGNGDNCIWFCGVWCCNGFYEDGVVLVLDVVEGIVVCD